MNGWLSRAFDFLRGPAVFQFVWRILTRTSPLAQGEIAAASTVFGGAIRYSSVRVAEGRILGLIFRFNQGRAFTTFHTVNLPVSGPHSRSHLDIIVHELTHVCQFEVAGSVYIWQAIHAQRTTGYDYGGWQQLQLDRGAGKHLRDYNREQQGMIAQDYYAQVAQTALSPQDQIRLAYEPLIADLRNRAL